MAKIRLRKTFIFTIVFALMLSILVDYSLDIYADYNEIVDSFYIIDEDDNAQIIERTKEDLEEFKKENSHKTYTVTAKSGDYSEVVGEYDTLAEAQEVYNDTVSFFKEVNMFTGDNTSSDVDVEIDDGDDTIATTTPTYGIVRFNLAKSTINYTKLATGYSGYISPASTGDAAYIRTDEDGIVCKVSGVFIKVKLEDVALIEDIKDVTNTKMSNYYINGGYIYHRYSYYEGNTVYSASTKIGYSKETDYLKTNKTYYSYDGHYFYEEFEKMIDDYKNNTYDNSINKDKPFYNYYQYLSMHTKANYTAKDYNDHVASKNKPTSVILNAGDSYINAQNHYTINGLLMFGVSINESGWGTSKYAIQRYNLFGINAIDSNPDQADYFESVEDCLNYWAYNFISSKYLNGTDFRYRGPHLGDKNSGINIKYASDPYWGEKAAARGYAAGLEDDDYGRYSLAIAQKIIRLYKEPSTSSTRIYTSSTKDDKTIYDYPLTVLEKVTKNGVDFYKVRSDMALKDDRSGRDVEAIYDASRDYVYVLASDVTLVYQGSGKDIKDEYNYVEPEPPVTPDPPVDPDEPVIPEVPMPTHESILSSIKVTNKDNYLTGFTLGMDISKTINAIKALDDRIVVSVKDKDGNTITSGIVTTGMSLSINTQNTNKTYTLVIRGDTNGDGKISAIDYVKLRNNLDKVSTLAGVFLKGADVNNDGKVSALDYVKIRNHLDKKSSIVQ